MLPRLSAASIPLEAEAAKLLQKAYKALPNDPLHPASLKGQAALHRHYCFEADIHKAHSATLFTFHRAFLYFHERILSWYAKAEVRIPRWDTTYADNFEWTKLYDQPGLWHARKFQVGQTVLPARECIRQGIRAVPLSTAAEVCADFHGKIHGIFEEGTTMYKLSESALDPIFYAFHAELDHLFQDWLLTVPPNSPKPDWIKQEFTLFDPLQGWVRVTARELLDFRRLGYTKDGVSPIKERSGLPCNTVSVRMPASASVWVFAKTRDGKELSIGPWVGSGHHPEEVRLFLPFPAKNLQKLEIEEGTRTRGRGRRFPLEHR